MCVCVCVCVTSNVFHGVTHKTAAALSHSFVPKNQTEGYEIFALFVYNGASPGILESKYLMCAWPM